MTVTLIDVRDLDDTELGALVRAGLAEGAVVLVTDGERHAHVRWAGDDTIIKDDADA